MDHSKCNKFLCPKGWATDFYVNSTENEYQKSLDLVFDPSPPRFGQIPYFHFFLMSSLN